MLVKIYACIFLHAYVLRLLYINVHTEILLNIQKHFIKLYEQGKIISNIADVSDQ